MRTRHAVAVVIVAGGIIGGGAWLIPPTAARPRAHNTVAGPALPTAPRRVIRVRPATPRPAHAATAVTHRRVPTTTAVPVSHPRPTRAAVTPRARFARTSRPPVAATPVAPPVPTPPTSALPVGLTIPRLGIQAAPVYDRGLDATHHLPIAPGYAVTHYQFSAPIGSRGNAVLYGHDDIQGQIFRSLPLLQPGDRILLNVGRRPVVYEVTGSQIVAPTDVAVMAPTTTAMLTVISCYPYNVDSQRIVVRARLLSPAHVRGGTPTVSSHRQVTTHSQVTTTSRMGRRL